MKTRSTIAATCAMLRSANAPAHGYLVQPEARGYLCNKSVDNYCGAVQWDPHSLEGPSRFPEQGPADGVIAAAGRAPFSELNEQASGRWIKHALQAGPNTFKWEFTMPHKTRDWRYFITKADWDRTGN